MGGLGGVRDNSGTMSHSPFMCRAFACAHVNVRACCAIRFRGALCAFVWSPRARPLTHFSPRTASVQPAAAGDTGAAARRKRAALVPWCLHSSTQQLPHIKGVFAPARCWLLDCSI